MPARYGLLQECHLNLHLASLMLSLTTICKWEGFFRAAKTSFLKRRILTSNHVVLKDIRGNGSWTSARGWSLRGAEMNLTAVTWMPHLTQTEQGLLNYNQPRWNVLELMLQLCLKSFPIHTVYPLCSIYIHANMLVYKLNKQQNGKLSTTTHVQLSQPRAKLQIPLV